MDPVTIMVIGLALLGLAAWAIVSLVDPLRRNPRSVESGKAGNGRRFIRLLGLIFACGLILTAVLYLNR